MYRKVENEASLVRDTNNNALLNIDNESLTAYKKRKQANIQLKKDVDRLKEDMQEIKSLLIKLLDK